MKIAQLCASYTPVSKRSNKAIYSHVAGLTEGLIALGHDLHLFASKDSQTSARLYSLDFIKSHLLRQEQKRYEQWGLLSFCYKEAEQGLFDIIHSHFNVMSAFFADVTKIPTLISIHSPIEDWMIPILESYKHLNYVSFSYAQQNQIKDLNWVANICHGIDTTIFSYEPDPDDYVLFLGRITSDKGTHTAIEASKLANTNLRIAGASYETETYWHKEIAPHINGNTIRSFGEVSFEEKIPLLQKAKALLFPIDWEEPFGYAMIEAMSCGTPVIAFNRGSVPEIVKDGKTGFIVNSLNEMVQALERIESIDRDEVRQHVENNFSIKKMVESYDDLYYKLIDNKKSS